MKPTIQKPPVSTAQRKSNLLEFPIVRIGVNKSIAGMWPQYKTAATKN